MKVMPRFACLLCTGLFIIIISGLLLTRHLDGGSFISLTENLAAVSPAPSAVIIDGKLNINTATIEDLSMLPGIGEALAGRIVDYREENGGFHSLDELLEVRGIGKASLSKLKEYLTLGG